MNLIECMRAALKNDDDRREAEMKEQQRRSEAGLPSWDIFLSNQHWEAVRDASLSQGIVTKTDTCYAVDCPPFPRARILIAGRAGESAIDPFTTNQPPKDSK